MRITKTNSTAPMIIAIFIFLSCCPASAQTVSEIETLLDPIVAERMEKSHIPGAVISIVRDGKTIFTKGYGVADVEKKTPVVPDQTIFRIGSITKVFTALAAMQEADRR